MFDSLTRQKYPKPTSCQSVYNFDFGGYKLFQRLVFQIANYQYDTQTALQTLQTGKLCFDGITAHISTSNMLAFDNNFSIFHEGAAEIPVKLLSLHHQINTL